MGKVFFTVGMIGILFDFVNLFTGFFFVFCSKRQNKNSIFMEMKKFHSFAINRTIIWDLL